MTDNDLRKSRHWRCSQCGSSWPLDMAVCGNPACGADLGIYGQVVWRVLAALVLGVGHIGIHLQHRREIEG